MRKYILILMRIEMTKTLSTITQELVTANMTLELTSGEVDAMLENELIALQNELSVKVDHYVCRMQKLEQAEEFWKAKSKEASQVASSIAAHIEAMKDRIKFTMDQLQTNKLTGEMYKLSTRPTPKVKVNVIDKDLVPMEFKEIKQEYVVNKDKIREVYDKSEGSLVIEGIEIERGITLNVGINK